MRRSSGPAQSRTRAVDLPSERPRRTNGSEDCGADAEGKAELLVEVGDDDRTGNRNGGEQCEEADPNDQLSCGLLLSFWDGMRVIPVWGYGHPGCALLMMRHKDAAKRNSSIETARVPARAVSASPGSPVGQAPRLDGRGSESGVRLDAWVSLMCAFDEVRFRAQFDEQRCDSVSRWPYGLSYSSLAFSGAAVIQATFPRSTNSE